MKNDLLKVFFIIWGIILLVELVWFSSATSEAIFAITVIAVTSVFGSVGMYLFKS